MGKALKSLRRFARRTKKNLKRNAGVSNRKVKIQKVKLF